MFLFSLFQFQRIEVLSIQDKRSSWSLVLYAFANFGIESDTYHVVAVFKMYMTGVAFILTEKKSINRCRNLAENNNASNKAFNVYKSIEFQSDRAGDH